MSNKKEMNLITQIKFAEQTGISRQGISKALKNGLLPYVENGNKKMIDLNDPAVKSYIKNSSNQREVYKKDSKSELEELLSYIHPSEHDVIKKIHEENPKLIKPLLLTAKGELEKKSEVKQPKKPKTKEPAEVGQSETDDFSPHEINRQTKIADMRKKQMQVEILEKKYLPANFIEYCYIRYIERLHSTLERSAGVYIQEVGNAILNAGEILPEHIEKFTSLVLEAIHNNKKAVKREVDKYEPS